MFRPRSLGLLVSIIAAAVALSAQQPTASSPNSSGPPSQTAPQSQAPASPATSTPAPPSQAGEPTTVIPVTVNLVDVQFTVVNRRQKLITDLQKENFRVLDDGIAQSIQSFSRQTNLPLRIGLLLDTSNSIRERLRFEQDAAEEFLENVMHRGRDLAFVMTFDDQPEIAQDYTDNMQDLRDSIDKQRAGGATALYDAVYQACADKLLHAPIPPDDPVIRRVLVVVSDGDDNLSQKSRSQAIEMAERVGASIYTISTSTDWVTSTEESDDETQDAAKLADRKYHKEGGDLVLQALADTSGGRAFFPYRLDDLNQSFFEIGDELRSQYSIAWAPTGRQADGKFHTIQIQVDQKELIVRARAGYYGAPPALRKGNVSIPASPATAPPPPPSD